MIEIQGLHATQYCVASLDEQDIKKRKQLFRSPCPPTNYFEIKLTITVIQMDTPEAYFNAIVMINSVTDESPLKSV